MRNTRYGRQIILFILGLGLFAMLGAQSQCARVSDNTTGPTGSLVSGGGSDDDCNSDCESEFKDAWKAERRLFKDNIELCEDAGDAVACLQTEAQRHLDAQMGLVSAHLDCIGSCGGFEDFEECMEFCEKAANKMKKDARKIHKKILKACRDQGDDEDSDTDRDSDSNDRVAGGGSDEDHTILRGGGGGDGCQEMENIRYEKALTEIEAFAAECASNCHDQGGGSGGQ